MIISKRIRILIAVALLGGIIMLISPMGRYIKNYARGLVNTKTVASRSGDVLSDEAYEWKLSDRNGNALRFDQFKGKVIVLNFWATWCGPCIKEMPSFQSLYDVYGEKVAFLFLAEDDEKKVENLFDKRGFNLPVFYSESSVPGLFFSRTYPTTFILDKMGVIELASTESMDWNKEEIHKLLDRLLQE